MYGFRVAKTSLFLRALYHSSGPCCAKQLACSGMRSLLDVATCIARCSVSFDRATQNRLLAVCCQRLLAGVRCNLPRPAAPRRFRSRRKTTRQLFSSAEPHYRLYLLRSKLALAAMCLRRIRVAGRSFTAGVPVLKYVLTVVLLYYSRCPECCTAVAASSWDL